MRSAGKGIERVAPKLIGGEWLTAISLDGQAPYKSGGRIQFEQLPSLHRFGQRSPSKQGRSASRVGFHIEGVQRQVQSEAQAFQQRFLRCPAAVKPAEPVFGGQMIQRISLRLGKVIFRNVLSDGSNAFDIDSDRVAAGQGKRCEPAAMAQIEVKKYFGGWIRKLNPRLSILPMGERYLGGRGARILSEQTTHHRMGTDITVPVPGESESSRSVCLLVAEDLPVFRLEGGVQVPGEDKHRIGCQWGDTARKRPVKEFRVCWRCHSKLQ